MAVVTSSTGSLCGPGVGAGAAEADGADAGVGAPHVFHSEDFLSSPTRGSALVQSRKAVAQFAIIRMTL